MKALKQNIRPVAEATARQLAPDFEDAQREQLRHGTSAKGGRLRPYRSPAYAKKKAAMNSLPGYGNPDLKLTGAFYRGIKINITGSKIRLYSTDQKAPMLLQKYSEDAVFGLTPPNLADFTETKYKPAYKQNLQPLLNPR